MKTRGEQGGTESAARVTAGFTLTEVLVSLSLLAVVIVATFGLLPGLARANSATGAEQRVALAAKSFFERTASAYGQGQFDSPPPAPGPECGVPVVSNLSSDASGQVILKRVDLSCTVSARTYAFERDFARP